MDQQKLESHLVRAYAEAWNRLDPEIMFPLLADDVIYESQNVFKPLSGKREVEDYLRGKMQTIADGGDQNKVYAEIGYCGSQKESPVQLYGVEGKPAVVMAQGNKDLPAALVLLTINERDQIQRIDVCSVIPSPGEALRTGEYPGMEALPDAERNAMQENESQVVRRHLIWFDAQRHEYLRVAKEDLIALNIWQEMSPFSFEDEEFAYLEEDADAMMFVLAAQENDWILSFEHIDSENFPIIEEGGKPLRRLSEDPRCHWCREERNQFCDCPRLTCPICGVEAVCGEEVSIVHFSCGHLLAGWDDSDANYSIINFDIDFISQYDPGELAPSELADIFGENFPFYQILRQTNDLHAQEFWDQLAETIPQIKKVSFYHQPPGALAGWEAKGYFAENPADITGVCVRVVTDLKARLERYKSSDFPKIFETNQMASPGAKVWVLEINESKRFETDEVHVGGVFSSRENALDFLAREYLDGEDRTLSIVWNQSKHNEELFEGVDGDGIEYQIYTTTVDHLNHYPKNR